MLRVFCGASVALILAGCASIPQSTPTPSHKTQAVKAKQMVKTATAEQPSTPNQEVKRRWYDRFMKHKSK